ncbi:MAG: hypothetical protein Q9217_002723 [Psora testacea]
MPHPRYLQTWIGFRRHGHYLQKHTWRKKRRHWAKSFFSWKLTRQDIADISWDEKGRARQGYEPYRQLGPFRWLWAWLRVYPTRPLQPGWSSQSDDLAERGESSNVIRASQHVEDASQSTVRRRWIRSAEQSEMSSYLQQITPAAFQQFLVERPDYETLASEGDPPCVVTSAAAEDRDDVEAATSVPPYRSRRASSLPVNFFRSPRYSFVLQQPGAGDMIPRTIGTIRDAQPSMLNTTFPAQAPSVTTSGCAIHAAEAEIYEETYPALTPDGPAEGRSEDAEAAQTQSLTGFHKISARFRGWSTSRRSMPDGQPTCQVQATGQANALCVNREHGPVDMTSEATNISSYRSFSWDISRRSTLDVPCLVPDNELMERWTLQDYEAESSLDDATAFRDGSQTTISIYCDAGYGQRTQPQGIDPPKLDLPHPVLVMPTFDSHDWRLTPELSNFHDLHQQATAKHGEDSVFGPHQCFPRRCIRRRHSVSIPTRDEARIEPHENGAYPRDELTVDAQWTNTTVLRAQRTSPMPATIPSNDGAHDRLDVPRKRAGSPKRVSSKGKESSESEDKYTIDNLPSSTELARRNGHLTNPFISNRPLTPLRCFSPAGQCEPGSTTTHLHRDSAAASHSAAEILRPFSPDITFAKRSSSVPPVTLTPPSSGITEWQLHRRHQSISREFSRPASAERARRRLRRVGKEGIGVLNMRTEEVTIRAENGAKQADPKIDMLGSTMDRGKQISHQLKSLTRGKDIDGDLRALDHQPSKTQALAQMDGAADTRNREHLHGLQTIVPSMPAELLEQGEGMQSNYSLGFDERELGPLMLEL